MEARARACPGAGHQACLLWRDFSRAAPWPRHDLHEGLRALRARSPHSLGTTLVSGLVPAASTLLAAAPAQADINQSVVRHSRSYTQDFSGPSSPTPGVQAGILSNVKGGSDGRTVSASDGSVYNIPGHQTVQHPSQCRGSW